MSIQLSDNCGTPIAGAQIVATFSNGDPPRAFSMLNPSRGIYSGTWTPRKAASQVTIGVRASAAGFPDATAQMQGSTTPNLAPILTPDATLHVFHPVIGNGLAPGTIVQIYGQNLASQSQPVTTLPLATDMSGTEVLIGGMLAPLYYVSPGQVNAQIPFELDPSRPYQVILSANGALTTPDSVQLSPATPGLAAFSDGTLIAQHADGSVVSAAAPAVAGEYLVVYLAGMGCTNDMPPSGAASPSNPLARPDIEPSMTINGEPYPILFAGLTPGMVGLYQVNFQVPAALPTGNLKLVITQNGQGSNQTILPYQP
jgi:uncharacterized protein (TIGR03437 family)